MSKPKLPKQTSPQFKGFVISRFGQEADIELESGEQLRCHLRRKLENLVCGDNVICEPQDNTKGIVVKILPRTSVLERPIRYQGLKAVAANLDQICIVVSIEPDFSELILDKYLVAAELAQIPPIIIFNKSDLEAVNLELKARLDCYQDLGYRLIWSSVKTGLGMEQITEQLNNNSSVFVGQSGVGKSSLINYLLPDVEADVSCISDNSGLGTHTTTASRLYHFGENGRIIDSPGIRDFSMEHVSKERLSLGYIEIHRFGESCKFRNCLHTKEPGCAVKLAVDEKQIDAGRYQRYLKIMAEE
jgi:ribosome biogenesis GTPase